MQLLKMSGGTLLLLGVLLVGTGPAWGQDAEVDQAKASFTKGTEAYAALKFAEARTTLLKVDRSKLSEDDGNKLDQLLVRVTVAIDRQAEGIEQFRTAQELMKTDKLDEAAKLFEAVRNNGFVPIPTRRDAQAMAAEVAAKIQRVADKTAADAKVAAEKTAADKAAADKTAADKVAADKVAADKTAADKVAADKTAADKVAADKVAADGEAAALDVQAKAIEAKAQDLIERGGKALRAGDPSTAAQLFRQALVHAPNRVEAKDGLANAKAQLAKTPAAGPMAELIRRRELAAQLAKTGYQKASKAATAILETAENTPDFRRALSKANEAKGILEGNRSYLVADEYAMLSKQVDELIVRIGVERQACETDLVKQQLEALRKAGEDRRLREASRRAERIATLKENISLLETQQQYEQALEGLTELLRLDRNDGWALAKKESVRLFHELQIQKGGVAAGHEQADRHFSDMRWAKTPWFDIVNFPDNWPDIRRRRDELGGSGKADAVANRAVRAKLALVRKELKIPDVPFEGAIDFLRDVTNVNIIPRWAVLEAQGIDRAAPINLVLNNVTNETALRQILSQAGGVVELDYLIENGIIQISTKEDLSSVTVTQIYSIREFVAPSFVGPDMALKRSSSTTTSNSGGGGGDLFGGGGGDGQGGRSGGDKTQSREDMVESILDSIRQIEPESWQLAGGTVGSVRELNGQLIITHTADTQRRIDGMFAQLRERSAIQVNVEARFITVSTAFLNDIGVNLNFFFNIGSTLTNTGDVDPITGANLVNSGGTAIPGQWGPNSGQLSNRLTPMGAMSGSSEFATPSSTGVPGSLGGAIAAPALALSGTFLDDIQVDFLIRATQADVRSTTLTAPRLTLLNGQRAYVMIGTEQAYVSDLASSAGDNVASFDPEISTVTTGTTLDVEVAVSDDKKWVTMTVRPQVSAVNAFNQYVVSGTVGDDGQIIDGTGFIQLPTVTTQRVETSVRVPDQGTLLIGGQRLAGEVTREMGVPILSKIPIINRAFTNRSMVKDELTLLILVKPTIIIPQEIEDNAYPI